MSMPLYLHAQADFTVNPNPIDFGYCPDGAWKSPTTFSIGTKHESIVIEDIKSTNPYFNILGLTYVLPATIYADNPLTLEVIHGEGTGEMNGYVVFTYNLEETTKTDSVKITAIAYKPEVNDVWETAEEITLPFNDTPDLTNLYNNYELPGEEEDGIDIVYKLTLQEETIISAQIEGENGKIAIYDESFGYYGGPQANNFYSPSIAQDPNAETIFSYDFNDKSLEGWRSFEKDNDHLTWMSTYEHYTYDSDTDHAIFSYSYYNGTLYPDNFIVTSKINPITENSVLSFDVKPADITFYKDKYGIVVSTDNENWTVIYEETINFMENTHKMVSLKEYAGQNIYVGFRHFDCSGNEGTGIIIDNVTLSNTNIDGTGIKNAILPAGIYYIAASGTDSFTVDIKDGYYGESIEEVKKSFNIYPNPASDMIYINSENDVNVRILDMTSRCVKETRSNGFGSINVEDLNNGIYFIQIKDGDNQHIEKIVIE